jgi:hypothetical protein
VQTAPHRLLALVMFASLALGCRQHPEPPVPAASSHAGLPVSSDCIDGEPATLFPKLVFGAESDDAFIRGWAGRYLQAAQFEPLWCGERPSEAYRLAWIPDYRSVLIIEVARLQSAWNVRAAEFLDPRESNGNPNRRGEVTRRWNMPVDVHTVESFLRVVSKSEFWASSTELQDRQTNSGTMWIVEARRQSEYRTAYRAVLKDEEVALVREFVNAAGLDWEKELVRRR